MLVFRMVASWDSWQLWFNLDVPFIYDIFCIWMGDLVLLHAIITVLDVGIFSPVHI